MATVRVEKNRVTGIYTALSRAAFTPEVRMVSVSSWKSLMLRSSTTRVLMVLAPVIPSLKAPVILEFCLRTFRFQSRMRGWKKAVRAAMTGTITMMTRARRQLRKSMAAKEPRI